jgi:hypothetical protein
MLTNIWDVSGYLSGLCTCTGWFDVPLYLVSMFTDAPVPSNFDEQG